MSEIKPLEPEEIRPDELGYWTHSAWEAFCSQCGDDEYMPRDQVDEWFQVRGLEYRLVELEYCDETSVAWQRYFEEGEPDVLTWELSPPGGDGWILLSIHDTEDGPVQLWTRPVNPAPGGSRQARGEKP